MLTMVYDAIWVRGEMLNTSIFGNSKKANKFYVSEGKLPYRDALHDDDIAWEFLPSYHITDRVETLLSLIRHGPLWLIGLR